MIPFYSPVAELIRQRYSCRAYTRRPIAVEQASQLAAFASAITRGPLGTPLRFELVVAHEHDPKALRGLGTYGLLRNPAGFIIGAVGSGANNLEDYGYGMETIILHATDLGLGTCWLGGNFTKSSFSKRIRATPDEIVPAVASTGYAVEGNRARDRLRQRVKADRRLSWEALFFQSGFGRPLSEEAAGAYAQPLAMLRLAPSSHNYQPWRVVEEGPCYHFYLQRTPGYGPGTLTFAVLGMADLQRIDIGIAMCHFEWTAREAGLEGRWIVQEPLLPHPGAKIDYVVTWLGEGSYHMNSSDNSVLHSR